MFLFHGVTPHRALPALLLPAPSFFTRLICCAKFEDFLTPKGWQNSETQKPKKYIFSKQKINSRESMCLGFLPLVFYVAHLHDFHIVEKNKKVHFEPSDPWKAAGDFTTAKNSHFLQPRQFSKTLPTDLRSISLDDHEGNLHL